MNTTIIFGLIIISLVILLVVMYYLILRHTIKNKKKILFFLERTYSIVFYTLLYCFVVNFAFFIIIEYTTSIEIPIIITTWLLPVYLVPLIIPRIFIFCLQISVKKEENNGKITFFEALELFWSISKKTN